MKSDRIHVHHHPHYTLHIPRAEASAAVGPQPEMWVDTRGCTTRTPMLLRFLSVFVFHARVACSCRVVRSRGGVDGFVN